MFLHLSVCPRGEGSLLQCMLGYPPEQAPPREQTPPQQTASIADGTHPTGMHSCLSVSVSASVYIPSKNEAHFIPKPISLAFVKISGQICTNGFAISTLSHIKIDVVIKHYIFAIVSVCSRISHMILCTTAVQRITAMTKRMIYLRQTIYQMISCRHLHRLPVQNIRTTTCRNTESR